MQKIGARRLSFLMLAVALLVTGKSAQAAEYDPCSEQLGRECTGTEELANCIMEAAGAYRECQRQSDGLWDAASCLAVYEADYYYCNLKFIAGAF